MTAWINGYVHLRCHYCEVVYQWPDENLPRHLARCPQCHHLLYVTSQRWSGRILTRAHQP